jgi:hypothetical protein
VISAGKFSAVETLHRSSELAQLGLRARRERPCRDAAEQRYELAPFHVSPYLGSLLSNCCATRMMSSLR